MDTSLRVESWLDTSDKIGTLPIASQAKKLEELGFDRAYTAEQNRDPFLPLVLAADRTERLGLGTSIAVALARNPMNVAVAAQDLNIYSEGRFRLGLGSQIKPHILRRFNMPWHGAAKQTREFIQAVRAIWDSWFDGVPLDFKGEYYQYSLMTPEFTPVTEGFRRPPILQAAVGPLMVQTAAEVADGLVIHPFCTELYLKKVIVPRIEPVLSARGLSLETFELQYPIFIATGETEEEFREAKDAIRYRIGFYGSTPSYKPVLDLHGWGDLQPVLRNMTKEGKWDQLGAQITDEMLETFAAVGEPADVARIVRKRAGGIAHSVFLDAIRSPDVLAKQMEILRG